VTEMRRIVKGEVIASSSDREATAHIRMAELVNGALAPAGRTG